MRRVSFSVISEFSVSVVQGSRCCSETASTAHGGLVKHTIFTLVEAVGWLISRAGFTPAAVASAHEAGVMLSTADDLAQLARLVY